MGPPSPAGLPSAAFPNRNHGYNIKAVRNLYIVPYKKNNNYEKCFTAI
jgi:hypothetical protein